MNLSLGHNVFIKDEIAETKSFAHVSPKSARILPEISLL